LNPVVAPAENLKVERGRAALEVEMVFGESTVTSAFATSPMKLLTPRSRGQSAWACTSSFGGGLVAGDQTQFDVKTGAGTRCYIGTQASTKIYRNPAALPCGHRTEARLGANSLLVFAPDPVQPFALSSYTQRQEFHLAEGAGLVLLDWFSSGRAARGERWEFARFQSRNDVFVAGKLGFMDSLLLAPDQGPLAAQHRAGRFNCLAVLLLIGAPLQQAAAELLRTLSARPVERLAALVCSASPIGDGAVLRVAGESVEEVGWELRQHLTFLIELLGDDPWVRKW
jgi:urease accessory protein